MSPTRPLTSITIVIAVAASMLLATDSVEVEPGDTLSEIAATNGVSLAELIEWNDIADPDLIYAGTQLVVAAPSGAPGNGGRPATSGYMVKAGDTLSMIAKRFGMRLMRIVELNRISDPNLIYVGQELTIDDASEAAASSPVNPALHGYTVKVGDTLLGIASRFGVSMSTLVTANAISNPNRIETGRTLTIPDPAAATTTPPPATTTTTPSTTTTTTPPVTVPDPSVVGAASLSPLFAHWASAYSVPQGLLEALAWKESNWRPDAVGPGGHLGISQMSPDTIAFVEANLLGVRTDPLDASNGIRLEARYLRYLIDRTDNERHALEAWNQGLHDLLANGASPAGSRFADEVLEIRDARS